MFIPENLCWFIAGAVSMLVGLLIAAGYSAYQDRKKTKGTTEGKNFEKALRGAPRPPDLPPPSNEPPIPSGTKPND